jgi:hypothetical protein
LLDPGGVEYKALVNASINARLGVGWDEESIAEIACKRSEFLSVPTRESNHSRRSGCTSLVMRCVTVVDVSALSKGCVSWQKLTLTVVVALDICAGLGSELEDDEAPATADELTRDRCVRVTGDGLGWEAAKARDDPMDRCGRYIRVVGCVYCMTISLLLRWIRARRA